MKAVIRKILSLLLYAALYAAVTALVCVTGAIHPVFFVCYQITAGILLSGTVMTAFRRMKGPGIAACMFLGLLFLLIMIQDASAWHVIPLIAVTAAAEVIRDSRAEQAEKRKINIKEEKRKGYAKKTRSCNVADRVNSD